jgi:group I intron endonuclease
MEEEKKFTVYEHLNSKNGKRYIGITSQALSRRFRNGEGYKSCVLFYRAIQKYGWDNFNHNILYKNLTKEEACQKEKELINKYKSNNPDFGYNLLSGGQFFTHAESSKQKNREAHLGKKIIYSEETKHRVSKQRKALWNSFSDEERAERLNKMQKGREKMPPLRNRGITTKIRCVELNKEFDSIADAEEWLGHSRDCFAIGKVLNGKRKTTGGYHWEYVEGRKK